MAPVLGELAFFLGIVQPMAVRTRPDGDVQLLVLTKDEGNVLFDSYPEQVFVSLIAGLYVRFVLN